MNLSHASASRLWIMKLWVCLDQGPKKTYLTTFNDFFNVNRTVFFEVFCFVFMFNFENVLMSSYLLRLKKFILVYKKERLKKLKATVLIIYILLPVSQVTLLF